jgi:prepilin-type N-terminal cleavage/methylation domain-containing protein
MKGFSLVELLVAMAITLVVAATTLSLLGPAHDAFQVQPESADLQQRIRVGIDALHRDVLMAGAGMYAAGDVGPLHRWLPPVMPYRAFGAGSDAAGGTYFRTDAISLLFVPSTASQTTLAEPVPAGALDVTIENPATCPAPTASQACGLVAGDQVLVFEPSGVWDVFAVDRVNGGGALSLRGSPPARGFAAGADVTHVRAVTYALRADPASRAHQLVRSEGLAPAQPVFDHIVKLEFQYLGEPEPPRVLDESEARPRATYGPAPPPVDAPLASWPPGENCVFALVDGEHQPRLAVLGATGSLVPLAPAMLTDGPWCPDADAPNRFDADLLRIRRVRFALRVQTPLHMLRGPAGMLFTNGGLAGAAGRSVPDLEIQFDVTPRNMNLKPNGNAEP